MFNPLNDAVAFLHAWTGSQCDGIALFPATYCCMRMAKEDIEEAEALSMIITEMIKQRKTLGWSQR